MEGWAYLAHVRVDVLEPHLKLLVFVRIVNQSISDIKNDIHALPIHEPLEHRAQF